MEERIEFGVLDAASGKVVIMGSEETREDAIRAAEDWSRNLGKMFVPVQRKVTITDWEAFNTGVVPPFETKAVEG